MMTDDVLWTPLALVAPLGARVSGALPARGASLQRTWQTELP